MKQKFLSMVILICVVVFVGVGIVLHQAKQLDPSTMEYCYVRGEEFYDKKEYDVAFDYFIRAAESGHADSQYYVGYMYYFGYGVKKDNSQAREWLEKSAKQGNKDAQNALKNWKW